MMDNADRGRIASYYDRLVEQYGYSPRARDSAGESSLAVRYEVLSEVCDPSGKRVLEVGCGFGDLGRFLSSRYPNLTYLGIDISRRMIETGRQVHPELDLREAEFLAWQPSQPIDIVLAQGIFYLLGDDAEAKMHRLIRKMFALANQAVAFCTLSARAPSQQCCEFYADPYRTLATCHDIAPYVVLRHDYLPNDFAIYMYRAGLADRDGRS